MVLDGGRFGHAGNLEALAAPQARLIFEKTKRDQKIVPVRFSKGVGSEFSKVQVKE